MVPPIGIKARKALISFMHVIPSLHIICTNTQCLVLNFVLFFPFFIFVAVVGVAGRGVVADRFPAFVYVFQLFGGKSTAF